MVGSKLTYDFVVYSRQRVEELKALIRNEQLEEALALLDEVGLQLKYT